MLVEIQKINGKRFFNGVEIIENPNQTDENGFVGDVAYRWTGDKWIVDEFKTEMSFNVNELEKTYKKPETDNLIEKELEELGL